MISFRKCLPSDVLDAIPLIYASGPDAFNYVFKNDNFDALGFLHYAFTSKGGEFSYDNHYVMIKSNSIIGIGTTFDYKEAKKFARFDGFKIIKYYGLRSPSVLSRGLKVEKIIKHPQVGEIIIAHIAILATERSKGYGQKMIEFLMKNSQAKGSIFALDVSEENPRAKDLYLRLGFTEQNHLRSNLKSNYGIVYNHYRMVKIEGSKSI